MTDSLKMATAAALVLLAAAWPAAAQTAKAPAPVNIEANEMEIIDADKKAIFRGNVDATRGDTNLKSDDLTVLYAEVKQPDGTAKTDATQPRCQGQRHHQDAARNHHRRLGQVRRAGQQAGGRRQREARPGLDRAHRQGTERRPQHRQDPDDRRPREGQFPAQVTGLI